MISFFRENEIPEELHESLNQLGLITKVKHVPADDADRFAARKSQEAIETNLPNRFSLNDHVRAWKYYGVRPPENAEKKADTDIRYCVFNAAFGRYSYTQAWVDKLSEELVDPTRFEEVTGHLPRPKS